MDTNGCYYDKDGNQSGWISLSEDYEFYELYDMNQDFKEKNENQFIQTMSKYLIL